MTVKELKQELDKFDENKEVVFEYYDDMTSDYSEDYVVGIKEEENYVLIY